MKYLDKTEAVRRKFASKRHSVLRDTELRSVWTLLRVHVTNSEFVIPMVGLSVLGAFVGFWMEAFVGPVISPLLGQGIFEFGGMYGAVLGCLLGFCVVDRPLTPLDSHDLAYVSDAVSTQPELFGWVAEALKRGDTLRNRDYAFIRRTCSAIRRAECAAEELENSEVRRNAAIAQIMAAKGAASAPEVIYSELNPSSAPVTRPEVVEWAFNVAEAIRANLDPEHEGAGRPCCSIWAYRLDGTEYICADFYTSRADPQRSYSITFSLSRGTYNRFSLDEPSVPDAAEALHRIGLVLNKLGGASPVDIGWEA